MSEDVTFRYGMRNRPPGFASVPAGYVAIEPAPEKGQAHHDVARFGVVVYAELLDRAQIRSFELVQLLDDEQARVLAEDVARQMAEYAADYENLEHDDLPAVISTIVHLMGKVRDIPVSVPDREAFYVMVMDFNRQHIARKKSPGG